MVEEKETEADAHIYSNKIMKTCSSNCLKPMGCSSYYEVYSKCSNKNPKLVSCTWDFQETPRLSCSDKSLLLVITLFYIFEVILLLQVFDYGKGRETGK